MPQLQPVPNPTPSYWLSQPSHLKTLRTTASLPETCDIAIIGSGMAGILTAYHILQSFTASSHKYTPGQPIPSIILLEARDLCSGATARNGGHCKIKTTTLLNLGERADEMFALVKANRKAFKRISETENIDCELEVRRSFDVFLDADEAAETKSGYLRQRGKEGNKKWTQSYCLVPQEHVEQVTSIKGAKLALSVPVVSLWPYKFATGLLERLVEKWSGEHLNVQTNTSVTGISSSAGNDDDDDPPISMPAETVLTTPRGALLAKKVVFATNAYTAGLLPQFTDTITPIKGMASHIVPSSPINPHLNNTYNITFSPEKGTDYLNPRPDGTIVVGGGGSLFKNDRPLWYNDFDDSKRFPDSIMAYWDGYMGRTFHGWDGGEKVESAWVGTMGITPDGQPHVGRVPGTTNQWILAGFNGGGNALIGVCAEAVAEMVLGDLGFEDVAKGYGIPGSFKSGEERMQR
ncbi:FAD dependent oxidoreductase [Periconia macrospinosa]|uniref:FAD dependent oxidoreductase n=1 Tax=Periconia macrospinosa TaxID=97972 RepID=A0A2V1DZF9_9PLEO|nr:FAD dependent oxidoreductase [Periconia macrospinosa]